MCTLNKLPVIHELGTLVRLLVWELLQASAWDIREKFWILPNSIYLCTCIYTGIYLYIYMYLYISIDISEEFQFSLLTHYSFNASSHSTGHMTVCLEMTVQHRFLDWERLPGWNDLSCAPASFTPKREAFWIQLPIWEEKKKSMVCAFHYLTPPSSVSQWQSTGSHVTAILLFPNTALQQCVGEERLSNKIFICFCNFCTPFNYEAPLVCWNKVNGSIIIVSA